MKTKITIVKLIRQKTNWVNSKFLLLLTALFLTVGAFAQPYQNYYVSASAIGSNSNDGKTSTAPFQTIQKAIEEVEAGGTVFIMNGIYSRNVFGSVMNINKSGLPDKYITFKNFDGDSPKLKASGESYNAALVNGSYIIIDGLDFEGDNANLKLEDAQKAYEDRRDKIKGVQGKYNNNAISIGAAHHVIIRNCKVHDFPAGGIGVGDADYVTIENNTVYNNSWYTMFGTSGISVFGPKGIDNNINLQKIIIRNNVVYGNKTQVPWFTDNKEQNYDPIKGDWKISDGNGIILDANNGTQEKPIYTGRTLVENNVCYNNGGGGIHAFQAARVDIINNTAYNNGTVVGYPEIDGGGLNTEDVKIFNNIMYARTGGECNANSEGVTYNHNIYFNGPASRKGDADIIADPQFVTLALNASADFRLKNTSPAIDLGSTATGQFSPKDILGIARPVGGRSDRGAYEFQGTPVYGPVLTPAIQYIYSDTLDSEWTDGNSFGNIRNLNNTTTVKTGLKSIKVNFTNNYGGLTFTRATLLSTTNLEAFKFWVYSTTARSLKFKTQSEISAGPSTEVSFTTEANVWKEITITKAQLGNPTLIKRIFFNANNFTGEVIFDEIRFVPVVPTLKNNQSITFNALAPKTVGNPNFSGGAIASSGLAVSYTSSNTAVATIVNGLIQIVGAGTSVITALQVGNANYNPAKSAVQTLTVNKNNQTITFNSLAPKTFGDANFNPGAVASSGLAISYSSSNTAVATIIDGLINIVGSGTSVITASQAGNASFNAATSVTQTLTVTNKNQTITFNPLATKTFGDANFNPEAVASSGLAVSYSSSNTAVATIIDGLINIVGAGTSVITASQAGNASYNAATSITQTLTVTSPVIVTGGLSARYYDNINFTGAVVERVDPNINFNWGTTVAPALGIAAGTYSVLWDGYVKPNYTGLYTFYTSANDGIRVWVNNQLIIDNFVDQSGSVEQIGTISLNAGQSYIIQVQYYNNTYEGIAKLSWSHASLLKQIIPQQNLSPAGNGFGLWGTYYNTIDLTGQGLGRIEPTINFNWATGSPASTIDADTFSARWRGQVKPEFTENYTFYTNTDDGVRLWINGVLLIDKWIDQSATENNSTITLIGGQKYNIVMEYYENTGDALAQLSWSSASQAKQIIPQTRLYPTTGALFENAAQNFAKGTEQTIVSENTITKDSSISIYPNPAKDQVNVTFYSETENDASVEILTMTSTVVSSKSFQSIKGNNSITLDVSSFLPGIYILNVKNGSNVAIKKIIITK